MLAPQPKQNPDANSLLLKAAAAAAAAAAATVVVVVEAAVTATVHKVLVQRNSL